MNEGIKAELQRCVFQSRWVGGRSRECTSENISFRVVVARKGELLRVPARGRSTMTREFLSLLLSELVLGRVKSMRDIGEDGISRERGCSSCCGGGCNHDLLVFAERKEEGGM